MNAQKLYLPMVMFLLIVGTAFAANTVTLQTPAAGAQLYRNASLVLNATLDTNTLDVNSCVFKYQEAGKSATTIATVANNTVNDTEYTYTWAAGSMPVYLPSTTDFFVNCSNSTAVVSSDSNLNIGLRGYEATDLPKAVIDFLASYWVQLVAFAAIFALALALYLVERFGLLKFIEMR